MVALCVGCVREGRLRRERGIDGSWTMRGALWACGIARFLVGKCKGIMRIDNLVVREEAYSDREKLVFEKRRMVGDVLVWL